MRVQRVLMPGTGLESWTVLGEDQRPVDQQIISVGLRRLAPAVFAQHDDGRPLPPRGEQARGYKQQVGSSATHNACNASGRTR